MMNERNIVLVGFMGSGKSKTANKLAGILKRRVVSTDAIIEQKEGRAITDIFRESGEAYFRKVEKDVVKEVSEQRGMIMDCGGGVVLDPDNMANLRKNGLVIYLAASPEYIHKNIKNRAHRPLLNVADRQSKIAGLLKARKPYYEKADVMIDADKGIDQIVGDILKVLEHE